MKKLFFFFCLFISMAANAQEICNNGIDDDADGLIDLNDTVDCKCISAGGGAPVSLIKNPSFEDYSSCPTSFSQLSKAIDWVQATSATSDYFTVPTMAELHLPQVYHLLLMELVLLVDLFLMIIKNTLEVVYLAQ